MITLPLESVILTSLFFKESIDFPFNETKQSHGFLLKCAVLFGCTEIDIKSPGFRLAKIIRRINVKLQLN